MTYRGEHLAGAHTVVEAHPGVVVGVFSRAKNVLVAHVERLLIGHPVSTTDTDGVATVEVPKGVHAVSVALPVTALEVPPFIEDNLERRTEQARVKEIIAVPIF